MDIVSVVGLGYVGLPLAVECGKKFETIGYDLSEQKIASYKKYCDPTGEVCFEDLKAAKGLFFTTDPAGISEAISSSMNTAWISGTPMWWTL